MTQPQPDERHHSTIDKNNTKNFPNFWIGTFFLLSSVSLFILMLMFIFIWQPIWTEGFKDFHTVSNAIDRLDKTAKPASEAIPLILTEMNQINQNMHQMNSTLYEMKRMSKSMHEMQNIMHSMRVSIGKMEQMTPEVQSMRLSIEHMTAVLSTEIPRMTYTMDRLNNKMPKMDFMPFK